MTPVQGYLYVLTGAAGCGKTTLLNSMCDTPSIAAQARASKAPKYTTRKSRGADDDCKYVPKRKFGGFDIAYRLNKNLYGLRIAEIKRILDQGKNAFVIASDLRIVRRIKQALPTKAKTIYVSSAVDPKKLNEYQVQRHDWEPDPDAKQRLEKQFCRLRSASRLNYWKTVAACIGDLDSEWQALRPDAESTQIREQRIRMFHTRYIDHIQMFDHVILNYTEDHPEEMTQQMLGIVAGYCRNQIAREVAFPPLFVVAAASGAGKGTLMEMMNLIGTQLVRVVSKKAKREKKKGDKRDGMKAIGNSPFPNDFDFRWVFHKPKGAASKIGGSDFNGVEYAVSSSDIAKHLHEAKPQIVISNFQQFGEFRQRFGNHAVFVYLHRLWSRDQMRKFQYDNCEAEDEARARIDESESVHADFISHIPDVNHVLLNTTVDEDLYDQMFQLLEWYSSPLTSGAPIRG